MFKSLIPALVLTLCFASAHAQQVAITFDDLPVHGSLPPGETRLEVAQQILAAIKTEHLPPVYGMVNAIHLKNDPKTIEVLNAWRAAAQPLASHTYSHMDLSKHTAEEFEQDIINNEKVLEALTKNQREDWRFLRYPYLQEGETPEKRSAVRQWLTEHHYTVAEVTLEFNDYNFNPPYARCMTKHDDAAVAHLHDLYLSTAKQHFEAYREEAKLVFGHEIPYILLLHIGAFDARMFPELIDQMKASGFAFITLPEAAKDPAYVRVDAAKFKGNGPLDDMIAHGRDLKVPHRDDPTKELEAMCR